MLFVAGIDALWAVARKEILVELESRSSLRESARNILPCTPGRRSTRRRRRRLASERSPTVWLAPFNGVSTGRLALPTGVGTVTMNVLQSASACRSVEKRSCLAPRSSSLVVSSVESMPRSSSAMRSFLMSKPTRRVVLAELDRERQPDIAEPDDADAGVLDRAQRCLSHNPAMILPAQPWTAQRALSHRERRGLARTARAAPALRSYRRLGSR